jgi:phosphoserine phosphatase
MRISVYDFDNTLIKENSLKSYVLFCVAKSSGNPFYNLLRLLLIRVRLVYIAHLSRTSKTEYLVKQLCGYSRETLTELGVRYVREQMKVNNYLLDELERDRSAGFVPYVISGSINEIISPASFFFKINDYRSSMLEYNNGICTGHLEKDIRGCKCLVMDEIISDRPEIDLSQSKFTSDNVEDVLCGKYFGTTVGVVLNDVGKKAWQKVTKNLISPDQGLILNSKHIYLLSYYYITVRTNWYTLIVYRILFPILVIYLAGTSQDALFTLFGWLAFISLYEIGYIDNDFYAVRREKNPSIRLSKSQGQYDVIKFIVLRILYYMLISFFLFAMYEQQNVFFVLAASLVNLALYLVHNRVPQIKRLFTYSLLKASHLYIPVVAWAPIVDIVSSIVLFYVPHTMISYARKIGYVNVKPHFPEFMASVLQTMLLLGMYLSSEDSLSYIIAFGLLFYIAGFPTTVIRELKLILKAHER